LIAEQLDLLLTTPGFPDGQNINENELFLNSCRARRRTIPAISNRVMIVGLQWHGKAKSLQLLESKGLTGTTPDTSQALWEAAISDSCLPSLREKV
jgi:hypothetical protein